MAKGRRNQGNRRGDAYGPEKPPDPRLFATTLAQEWTSPWTGNTYRKGTPVLPNVVARLDGDLFTFYSPEVVSFNLIEASKRLRRAERLRHQALAQRLGLPNGPDRLSNVTAMLDCLSEATTAVLLSFAAIEGMANLSIDGLSESAEIILSRRGIDVVIVKENMVRRLSIAEKLDLIVPMVTGKASVKGTQAWQDFVFLRRLRDELVHIRLGPQSDPDKPSAYARIMTGDASDCVQRAANLVRATRPEILSEAVENQLR
jgi:hypothetical protein